jgi:hypothetical protein
MALVYAKTKMRTRRRERAEKKSPAENWQGSGETESSYGHVVVVGR